MTGPSANALVFGRHWKKKLRQDPLAPRVLAALRKDYEPYAQKVLDRARRENPVIDDVIKNDLAETARHVLEHFRTLLMLPTSKIDELGPDPMAFVRAHGVRRAHGGVPLRAVLQAYRTGHKSFWSAICDTITTVTKDADIGLKTTMALSDYCIDYTDLISVVVADAYIATESLLAAQRTRVSIAVVQELLRGENPQSDEARCRCAQERILNGNPMVVIVARDAGANPRSVQDLGALAQLLESALPQDKFGRIIEPRGDEVVAVLSSSVEPGLRAVTALRHALSQNRAATADSVRVGVGLDVDRISDLPHSYKEALAAIGIFDKAKTVTHLADVSVDHYLRFAADATARRLAPPWSMALADGKFGETLEAFARASLNVKACASLLDVHGNTIYHRLNAIKRATGIDPRTHAGLSNLLAIMSVVTNAERERPRRQPKA